MLGHVLAMRGRPYQGPASGVAGRKAVCVVAACDVAPQWRAGERSVQIGTGVVSACVMVAEMTEVMFLCSRRVRR